MANQVLTMVEKLRGSAAITVACEADTSPPNSGDPEQDAEEERVARERLANGDVWAWGCITVTALYDGLTGYTVLGCLSYQSENDFRADQCFADMVTYALTELAEKLIRRDGST